MKLIVCGGRDFRDIRMVERGLSALYGVSLVVTGGANGVDQMADSWAKKRGVDRIIFPANWRHHGPAAGPIRNRMMIEWVKPDLVVAFPGGAGTANMVQQAEKAGVDVHRFTYEVV